MLLKRSTLIFAPLLFTFTGPLSAAMSLQSSGGLRQVPSDNVEAVYILPGADFRRYTKVMIDPPQVAFRMDGQGKHDSVADPGTRISNEQAHDILDRAKAGFQILFITAYQEAGYEVVTSPGRDVLRLAVRVLDLDLPAPETATAGTQRAIGEEAGSATLVLEAFDSTTGATLGRAVDARSTEGVHIELPAGANDARAFRNLFARWAKLSAEGLNELKRLSPLMEDTHDSRRKPVG